VDTIKPLDISLLAVAGVKVMACIFELSIHSGCLGFGGPVQPTGLATHSRALPSAAWPLVPGPARTHAPARARLLARGAKRAQVQEAIQPTE